MTGGCSFGVILLVLDWTGYLKLMMFLLGDEASLISPIQFVIVAFCCEYVAEWDSSNNIFRLRINTSYMCSRLFVDQ